MRQAVAALALIAAGLTPVRAAEPTGQVALLVASAGPEAGFAGRLREALPVGVTTRTFDLSRFDMADPIQKGRLVAALEAADLVVPVGKACSRFALDEVQDTPVYFVGGADLKGATLKSPSVGGMLAYDPDEIVELAANLWPGRLGIIYTSGFEPVAAMVREAAARRRVRLRERRVEETSDFAPAIEELLEHEPAVWLLGARLGSEPELGYAVERSISFGVPLIGATSEQVRAGALLCQEPPRPELEAAAAAAVKGIVERGFSLPSERIASAPPGGVFVVNRALAERFKVKLPPKRVRWIP